MVWLQESAYTQGWWWTDGWFFRSCSISFLYCLWFKYKFRAITKAPFLYLVVVFVNLPCFTCADIIDKLFQKLHPDNPVASGDEETKWRGYGGLSFDCSTFSAFEFLSFFCKLLCNSFQGWGPICRCYSKCCCI